MSKLTLAGLIFLIIGIWIVSFFVIGLTISFPNTPSAFGDTFGAINSLFSGLALAAIIYTLYLQRLELKYAIESQERNASSIRREISLQVLSAQLNALNTVLNSTQEQLSILEKQKNSIGLERIDAETLARMDMLTEKRQEYETAVESILSEIKALKASSS